MAYQTWLADVLRAAGLDVVEEPGWRTRTEGTTTKERQASATRYSPLGVIVHETRGSATSTASGEISVLINGRTGLSGPISQLFLSRAGVWHVVAAGLCHHVKTGWDGPFAGYGNSRLLGVEAQHAESESWSAKPVQYGSYVRGVAAILKHTGWPAPVGHKEHQPGDKPDPEFDMNHFRADVEDDMAWNDGDIKAIKSRVNALIDMAEVNPFGDDLKPEPNELAKAIRALAADVAELKARPVPAPEPITDEQLDAIAAKLAAKLLATEADADRARADVLDGGTTP